MPTRPAVEEFVIQPIQPQHTAEAKRMILSVARGIFAWPEPLEEVLANAQKSGRMMDVDDPWGHYFDRQGAFYVATHAGRVVGTGAIRRMDHTPKHIPPFDFSGVAELKRLWLLEEYHGCGLGRRMFETLLDFARGQGYASAWLLTSVQQARARRFYEKAGFEVMECGSPDPDDICMRMMLE